MGERKVLNKYYPPDFDPAKIPRRTQPKNKQMNIRMMLPMSIRCNTCGNYIYKGTKFNSRKEDVMGEVSIGTHCGFIFNFYQNRFLYLIYIAFEVFFRRKTNIAKLLDNSVDVFRDSDI